MYSAGKSIKTNILLTWVSLCPSLHQDKFGFGVPPTLLQVRWALSPSSSGATTPLNFLPEELRIRGGPAGTEKVENIILFW